MKKIGVILIFAIAAFLFVGCGDDGTALRWDNQSNVDLKDVVWKSSGSVNQEWTGTVADERQTDYKLITKLAGEGECLFDTGGPAIISLSPGEGVVSASTNSAIIEKDADATLIIDGAVTK